MPKRRRIAIGCALVAVIVLGIGAWQIGVLSDIARRASSLNNTKHMGIVFQMYANEDKDEHYPPPTPRAPLAVPDLARIYPVYLNELSILMVPSWHAGHEVFAQAEAQWPAHLAEAERIVSINHVYFGYAFSTEAELNALLDAIPTLSARYPQPIERSDGPPILSLVEAARLAVKVRSTIDVKRTIVMFENPRLNGGTDDKINVLYLDGRAATVSREDFFPSAHFKRLPADPVTGFW